MPSERPPVPGPGPTRESLRPLPADRGGVRSLLGLPLNDSGAAATLSTPSGGRPHEAPPALTPGGNDGRFEDSAADDAVTDGRRGPAHDVRAGGRRNRMDDTDTARPLPRTTRSQIAPGPPAIGERSAQRAQVPERPPEDGEKTRLVIPGVSVRKTVFPALSATAQPPATGTETVRLEAGPERASPLHSQASRSHGRETTTVSDVDLSTRLEQIAAERAKAQKHSPTRTVPAAEPLHGRPEPMEETTGDSVVRALTQRLERLQRTVDGVAATVSSQEARHRAEARVQLTRSPEPPGAPRAFWERCRLGRGVLAGR